ncbi:hypothetical protein ASD12_23980 [Mesorhizobium sp. Root102]|nr:hypothetical protein ASD12_23980 [Mesorhizobium sp. Root102]
MKDGFGPSSARLTTMVREMGYLAIGFQSGYELTPACRANAPASQATLDLRYVSECSVGPLPVDELGSIGAIGFRRIVVIALAGHRFEARPNISSDHSRRSPFGFQSGWRRTRASVRFFTILLR